MQSVTEALDGLGVTEAASRSRIIDLLTRIRQSQIQSTLERIQRGGDMRSVYAEIPHGGKENWLEVIAPLAGYGSTRTALRDMALFDRLGERVDEIKALIDEGSLAALQILSQASTPVEAVDIMQAEAVAGRQVTKARAYRAAFVAEALPGVEGAIAEGKITLEDVYQVAQAIPDAPDAVKELVVADGVRSPGVARLLGKWYEDDPQQFAEAAATHAIYSPLTGESVPLSQASETDAISLDNEIESERIKRSWAHRQSKTPAQRLVGTVETLMTALARFDPKVVYQIFIKPVEEKPEEKTG